MKPFTYDALPGRVVFGAGAVARLPEEVDHLGAQHALLVASPSNAATARDLAERLGRRHAGLWDRIEQHVPDQLAQAARTAAQNVGADCLVTIGGGSATGLGKAIALENGLPIIAIPTTYAGSEMTPVYGLTSGGLKRTGRDLRVLPKTVIYDPALTTSLPPSVTGPSGMNAMAHCVEALYAQAANPITSLMAEEGVRALTRGLPAAIRDPKDLEARSDALCGAYLAGAVLGAVGMALHHRICHVLGGTFGLTHGDVNAVLLPHVAQYNATAAPEAVARVARALGADDAPAGLFDFVASIGAPTSLAGLGLAEWDLDEAARLAVDSPSWNPRPVEFTSVRALLQDAYHGRRPSAPAATTLAGVTR